MPDFQTILLAVDDGVATLTLNRPDRLNAFTGEMGREILAAFDRIDADDDIRAVVVTGAGRAFCAGADLARGADTFNAAARGATGGDGRARRDTGGVVTLRIFECLKPVIAAINGPAVGVGASMTLPMDVRLIASDARMGFVFAARGIVPDGAASWFLPRVVGISQALEWCLTGRVFPATEAKEGGLVAAVVPGADLLGRARGLAAEMAANVGAVSAAITRQLLWRMQAAEHPMVAHRVDSRAIAETGAMADAAEGVMAFLEKRPASWTSKVSSDMPGVFPWWDELTY
ncbi:MAG: enoyl-CoA hydratase-related protein [Actinomycetota bacterium]|nr:enoyl-CoA hydratase-related protein [Actinomycetota bacterium]